VVKKRRDKVRSLNVYLLKDTIEEFVECIKNVEKLTAISLSSAVSFKGTVFVANQSNNPPWWLGFLREGTDEDIPDLRNSSTKAVLVFDASERRFAVTFGYGRSLLKPESYESDFGLKVTLNTVNEQNIRSIDINTLEEFKFNSRIQASTGSTIDSFGINFNKDILKAVSGRPDNDSFARLVAGSDRLAIRLEIKLADLIDRAQSWLEAYHSDKYKHSGFRYVDNIKLVKDPSVINSLDCRLIESLLNFEFRNAYFAPPEPIAWEDIEGFTFPYQEDVYPDLKIDDYFSILRERNMQISIDMLKRHQVGVKYIYLESSITRWTMYKTIIYETELENKKYILFAGDWLEVAKDFVEQVKLDVQQIPISDINLIPALNGEKESDYNERASKQLDFILLDQENIKCRGARTPIEACDLFTRQNQFIHIKRWSRSSNLSHLFAQGCVSAESFLADDVFREELQKKINRLNTGDRIIIPSIRPATRGYEVIYAMIDNREGWPLSLPFFSLLNLVLATERLGRIGFDYSISQIKSTNQWDE